MTLQPPNTGTPLDDAVQAVIQRLVDEGDPTNAQSFLTHYRQMFPTVADNNIGWLCGYLSHDDMVKGLRLFGVHHPFFGDADHADRVTADMALVIGMHFGEIMRAFAEGAAPFTGGTLTRW